jgi:glyoxylase-like metal-dependent hydrolase (beta-lactamase superfamily II)
MTQYVIHPLLNGRCLIAGHHAFYNGDEKESYPYALYLWLILGGERPMLVDTGLDNVEEMNQGAAHVLREPITQQPGERGVEQLARFGVRPEDVGKIAITHLHFDHVDCLDQFPNATIYVSGRGLEKATANNWHGSWAPGKTLELLTRTAKDRVVATDDVEVAPGIRTMWVGGHSPCSQAVLVDTKAGRVCLTGDTVSLNLNIERNQAVGVCHSEEECYAGMEKIRGAADIILGSHDPAHAGAYPNGLGA